MTQSFQQSPTIGEIAKALSQAQGEIESALKTSDNPHFRSKFADLAEVWSACKAQLSKVQICVVQIPQVEDGKLYLETMLVHASGEYFKGRMPLLNDKGNMQGLGSAITYARRYMLAAMVGVTQEDDDGNMASNVQNEAQKAPRQNPGQTTQQQTKPIVGDSGSSGFDPKNKDHIAWLIGYLDKKKVVGQWRVNVVQAMKGKKLQDIEAIIQKSNPEAPDEEPNNA
jgi:hypothetical protein